MLGGLRLRAPEGPSPTATLGLSSRCPAALLILLHAPCLCYLVVVTASVIVVHVAAVLAPTRVIMSAIISAADPLATTCLLPLIHPVLCVCTRGAEGAAWVRYIMI